MYKDLQSMISDFDQGTINQGGRFVWQDSVLVDALNKGHWLLIDNANFCRLTNIYMHYICYILLIYVYYMYTKLRNRR